ncbi:MAG: Uma2 family endonuclease [Armatimonadetes bacterium]|nr:Uma2 family endonuclease [Anaerolineae bacterium]
MTTAEQTQTTPLTLDAFMQLGAQYDRAEYINGEWIEKMPTVMIHSWIVRLLFRMLDRFCSAGQLGEVFSETTFAMSEPPHWVLGSRIPDIMFYEAARWAVFVSITPDWLHKPILIIPALVVEVVSSNDSYSDLRAKVQLYLRDGVQIVWVVDPTKRQIDVYEAERLTVLELGDTLSGGTLLPGFALPLVEVFGTVM